MKDETASYIFAQDWPIKTAKDHSNETKDGTTSYISALDGNQDSQGP
jgi:hypothetical protein